MPRIMAQIVNELRSALGALQSDMKSTSARVLQMENAIKSVQDNRERKQMEEALAEMKSAVERRAADEQRLQSREIDAETQLRAEQAKLADLQDQLDRLDKLLDSFTRKQP